MTTVRQLLNQKGTAVFSVNPQASVHETLEIMRGKNIGAALVIEKDELLGLFTERDFSRKMPLEDKSAKDIAVCSMMTKDLTCVGINNTLEDCMEIMIKKHIRHLPVVEYGRLAGFLTIRDLVKSIISNKEFEINELKGYISGEKYGARI